MDTQKFKFIKGACEKGCEADIYFYTDVDYWSIDDFLWEFKCLINSEVSKINIHINSAGGKCVDGISAFSRIIDCKIPTACYNDGLAASMASVIWAAGDEVYMKDYALLMIHNPFIDASSGKIYNQVTEAFTQQLKTIYQKRFGLDEERINAIMNGEGDNDGTFLTAEQAVEKGFINADHIIETPQAIRGQVESALKSGANLVQLKAVMNKISDLAKPIAKKQVNTNINQNKKTMNENEVTVFAALFGLTGEKATTEAVTAQITSLKAKAEKYDALKTSFDKTSKDLETTKAELQGANASVKNLQADLEKAKASLTQYQKAEADAKEQKINTLIEDAISSCKIDKADKETWVNMAKSDFALAESILAKIPAREDLSKTLVEGAQEAKDNMKSEEDKVQARVTEVVGSDFKYRKIE